MPKKFFLIALLLVVFTIPAPAALAANEVCGNGVNTCCVPPQILADGGGCPSGTVWIGSEGSGSCLAPVNCPSSPFSCATNTCVSTASGTAVCPGQLHIGSNVCADPLTVIRLAAADKAYKVWRGETLGGLVSIPADITCGDKDSPSWDAAQSKWVCAQGGGVWSKSGNDISSTNAGNVGIETTAPVSKLTVGTSLAGTALSPTFSTNAGALGGTAGNTLKLASFGFTSGNNTSLGIEARRTASVTGWETSSIGLKFDVDNTSPVNGAEIWMSSTGNVGVGTTAPGARLDVAGEIKGWGTVPVGTVMDWYCPATTVNATNCNALLPSNWKICDGGTVLNEPASPFNNRAVPNLVGKFVRGGLANYTDMGGTGGALTDSVTLGTHTHTGPAHTHTGPAHTHTGPAHTHTINHSHTIPAHRHGWVEYDYASRNWYSWAWTGEYSLVMDWGNGMDSAGSGIYPLGTGDANDDFLFTNTAIKDDGYGSALTGTDTYYGSTGSAGTGNTGSAGTGNTGSAGTGNTGATSGGTVVIDTVPPYTNLIKIIRIK